MYSEINIEVEDGNLGRNASTATHAQVKIGVSDAVSSTPVLITNSMNPEDIKAKLGFTPLADACIDATENGLKTIYAIAMNPDIDGEIGNVTHTGTGAGIFTVTGKPNNSYDIAVQITGTGNTNEGSFRYSIDGGNNFSEEHTIPLGGEYGISGTGLTLAFEDSSTDEKSFTENDVYSFSTTAPTLNNASVLKAVDKLISFRKEIEICHIVGITAKTLWAALQSKAEEFMTVHKRPLIFLCEARPCAEGETFDEYLSAMEAERKGISSYFICVSLSYAAYQRKDLRIQNINMAGVISGLIGQAKESLSIGCVEEFPISSAKLLKLLPEGIEEYSQELDGIGYTVFRQYNGKEDFYISNANVMASLGSDFKYVENVRVLNRIVRSVSSQATDKIQCEIDPDELEGSLKPIEAHLNIAMEDAERDKIISSGEVTIDTENLNILSDEELNVEVTWIPMGTVRKFNLKFSVNNPAKFNAEQKE
ncbi:MAG: DUF2586 domain-containing protein [Lachnospiraceae bacterium]|nr:DUF2586 domain-containing protein [Lachnospiraceae bacterium]MDE6251159.1 DUF2586 domain-containing protein [Lachnospiraceae bacterium]